LILHESQITPRGLTKEEAAAYCGCETERAFDDWVKRGVVPGAIPGTHRWDRKAIDLWLDRLSGLVEKAATGSALTDWKASRAAQRS
jgi:hypothetical protein